MFKKSLLTSIALLSFTSVQASQGTSSKGASAHPAPAHCPPCPCAGIGGWLVIPTGPMNGTCNQTASSPSSEPSDPSGVKHHPKKVEEHTGPQESEDDRLQAELNAFDEKTKRPVILPHIFNHKDKSNHKAEWGKALHGKVYVKHFGKWVADDNLDPNDIVSSVQGAKSKFQTQNDKNSPAQKAGGGTTGLRGSHAPQASHGDGGQVSIKSQSTPSHTPPEPTKQGAMGEHSQDEINKAKRVLHAKDGVQKWTKLITEGDHNKWYVYENNKWVLWDQQSKGNGSKGTSTKLPLTADTRLSTTEFPVQRGPGTYNLKVPGAPGTAEEKLNPVNRAGSSASPGVGDGAGAPPPPPPPPPPAA